MGICGYNVLMLIGDTVGSLTQIQHAILVGSILGDGTLRRQGIRTNALFEVNHSVEFKDYVDWKYEHLKEFVLTPPKSRKGNGKRVAYRFTTRSLPIFTCYYEQFYEDGRKIIPSNIKIDPLSLAVWFMDDGSKSRSSAYLNTQQFTQKEQLLLRDLLRDTFSIESTLNRDRKYRRLRITSESTKLLKDIIRPYVLPCFQYKIVS